MKLPAFCLMVAAAALAAFAVCSQETSHTVRKVQASAPVHITGPTLIHMRDLPQPAPSVSGVMEQTPPRIPAPERPGQDGSAPAANVIDSRAGIASAPTTAYGFEGLSNTDNMNIASLDLSQPDPQVAVGPDSLVEFINVLGRVYDRDGGVLQTFRVSDFFGVPAGHFTFNTRVVYDAASERWFATTASFLNRPGSSSDDGAMHLAVSRTSDPMGQWDVYHTTYIDIFPDQPSIGLTDDKVTISSAMYNIAAVVDGTSGPADICNSYCGEQTIVFQKSDLLAGVSGDALGRYAFPTRPDRFAVRPAQSLSATAEQYLGMFSTTSRSRLDIIRITGTPNEGNVSEAGFTELTILTQNDPPPSITAGNGNCIVFAVNNGPPPCIDSGDYRLIETIWRDNKMWLAAAAACQPLADDTARSCAHLIEVDTEATPVKTQDMMYGAPGEYYSWPAIRTDPAGNLVVVLAHTSPSIFAEVRVAGRMADDNANTMTGSTVIRAGEVVHTSGRWGDYLGAAVDPEHPGCIWVSGEFAKATLGRDWSTYIASTSYTDDCPPPPTPTPTPLATSTGTSTDTPTSTPTATPSATPTPLPRYGDVSCDTSVDSLDAVLLLQFGAGLLGSLNCAQNADVNGDGSVNSLDAAIILQFSAGLIASLPTG